MAMIPQSFLDELASRVDIVDVISDYVTLKGSGRSGFVGLCPFHREKTPSFSVSPDKQLFYCFGCHESGNVFNFIMKIENLGFYDSVKLLAERAGMQLPQGQEGERGIGKEKKERLLEANRIAARFYHDTLYTPDGAEGLAYLRSRGLSDAHIKRFGLGYAPGDYDALCKCLKEKGYTAGEIIEVGLGAASDRGVRDFFRNRVMFPIINIYGQVIAFGGRVMDKTEPKYLNTGDTPVFNKRKNLYGINIIKKNGSKKAILCEGYMDVIALNINGFDYAVASLGTALTRDQIKLLRRLAPEIYISYDGDRAGVNATKRAIEITRQEKIKARVIALKDGKDPDEYMRDYGPQAYSDAMNEAQWGADYLINGELSRPAQTDEDKARIAFSASQYARANAFDTLELEMYLRRISNATGYSLEALYRNVGVESNAGIRSLTQETVAPEQIKKEPVSRGSAPATERLLLRLLCEHPFLCKAAVQDDLAAMFSGGFRKELLGDIIGAVNAGEKPNAQSLAMKYVEDGDKSKEIGAVFVDGTDFVDPSAYYRQCITTLRKDALIKARAEAKERLDAYVRQELFLEDDELRALVRTIEELDGRIKALKMEET